MLVNLSVIETQRLEETGFFINISIAKFSLILHLYLFFCVYNDNHTYFWHLNDCYRANERIPELTSEIGRDLEVSAPPPQMVHNTTAGGGIHQLNPMVSVYQKDLFINHLRSMPPLDPVADLLISSSTASLADVLTPTPTQQTEYLLQPVLSLQICANCQTKVSTRIDYIFMFFSMQSMLNVAQSSNMAKNESMMLQIDSNKQLPHKTKGP